MQKIRWPGAKAAPGQKAPGRGAKTLPAAAKNAAAQPLRAVRRRFALIWLYGRQLPYGRSSSFSRLCQTFCTSSLSSSASSSLPILVSWSGSVSVVVVVGTMATSADKNS